MARGMNALRRLLLGLTVVGVVIAVLVITGVVVFPGRGVSPAAAPASAKSPAEAAPREEARPVVVTVTSLDQRAIQRTVDSVGTFQGFEEVAVTPKVGGRVVKIHYDIQDVVHTGDLLLEIDPTDYQLAVDEAQRALGSELTKIGRIALPSENLDVPEFLQSLPSYRRAVNVEVNAQSKRDRGLPLYQSRTLSKEEFDQINTDYEVARASRQQVEFDALSTLAAARQKQALLATAQQRLTDTRVEVPAPKAVVSTKEVSGAKGELGSREVAGTGDVVRVKEISAVTGVLDRAMTKTEYVVSERMISEGEMVGANTPKGVFRLVIDKTLKLMAMVPERYVSQVRVGLAVEVRVESYPDRVFQGRIARISPTVDRLSRTFQIEVQIPNDSRLLKPGGFAKLSVLTQIDPHAQTVVPEAVVSFAGVNKIFLVRDGKAHAVEITLGAEGVDAASRKRWVEIAAKSAAELKPGCQIITSGQSQLAEGGRVKVREASKQ